MQALFFVKSSKLFDPYEGTIPEYNRLTRHELNAEKAQPNFEAMENNYMKNRELTFISSWHLNDYESAAMWSLHSSNDSGIAIQSSFNRLCSCFSSNNEDEIYTGKVNYADFQTTWMNEWNGFEPFMLKRKSFESEAEIRAVRWLPELAVGKEKLMEAYRNFIPVPHEPLLPLLTFDSITDSGKYVQANLETLIEKIYVAPLAQSWFVELVRSLTRKYLPNQAVIQSKLYSIK